MKTLFFNSLILIILCFAMPNNSALGQVNYTFSSTSTMSTTGSFEEDMIIDGNSYRVKKTSKNYYYELYMKDGVQKKRALGYYVDDVNTVPPGGSQGTYKIFKRIYKGNWTYYCIYPNPKDKGRLKQSQMKDFKE